MNRVSKKNTVPVEEPEEEDDGLPQLSNEDKELIKQNWLFYQTARGGEMV
jgi:hypothetical protein